MYDWNLLSPQQRNLLVATLVMDWQPAPCTEGEINEYAGYWLCTCGWQSREIVGNGTPTAHMKPMPDYTTDMNAAWEVLLRVAVGKKPHDGSAELDARASSFFCELCNVTDMLDPGELYPAFDMLSFAVRWTPESICKAALTMIGLVQ